MRAHFASLTVDPLHAAWRLLLLAALSYAPVDAADGLGQNGIYQNGFDEPNTSWVMTPHAGAPTYRQRRTSTDCHSGVAAEQFGFLVRQPDPNLEVSHELPRSLVYHDLSASIWVNSNCTAVQVGLLLRFPLQVDPSTGEPAQAVLLGESYTKRNEWQRLTCRTSDEAVQDVVRLLRSRLRQQSEAVTIDQRTIIVERIVVQLDVQPVPTSLMLDDLEFGPVVTPTEAKTDPHSPRRAPRETQIRASLGDDQVLIDGRPSVVLFTPYQGEEVDALAKLHLNVAWIDRYTDTALLTALQEVGLLAMANPLPREIPLEEALQPDSDVGLVAFSDETSNIVFWNMGTRISPAHLQTQAKLMDKVRDADARFGRPVLVDVIGAEREFHRKADVIGSSRHILNTSTSLRDYHEYLRRKRKVALPDRPMFTLIQTEIADANLVTRADGQTLPLVEPEQIWAQGYAALSAGYKGIGFWKLTSLTAPIPGNVERRKAISLFNAHVQLLEPWLASAKFQRMVPATVGTTATARTGRNRPKGLDGFMSGLKARPDEEPRTDVQVAVFSCEQGLLLLPLWYENNCQFQPGPMTADELTFVVVAPENIQAWEVSTTSVAPLTNKMERPSDGWRIRLSSFDQFTAIVLTSGEAPIRELKQRAQALQSDCARDWIDLAVAKTERVADVHGKLAAVVPAIPNADWMLSTSRRSVDDAEVRFSQGDFDGARILSRTALRLTRAVQRMHWDKAVAQSKLTSGVSSPHTICFQTLPDHWSLVREIGKRPAKDENLLRSGGFEDSETFRAHGWDHHQGSDPNVRPRAELFGQSKSEGRFSLRLQADPVDPSQPPDQVMDPPERIVSPPIPVYAGQIVHISGMVQVVTPLTGNSDGLVIYESTKGTVGALRWREPTPPKTWQPFQLIREIHHSQDLIITIELRSLGDVRIDDLKVVAIDAE